MEDNKLKTICNKYFQNKIKQSQKYKELFSTAVDYEKKYLLTHKNDAAKLEQMFVSQI